MRGFDDPRGRQSEQLSFEAERALNAGELDRARTLFARAAELEEKVVADTNPGEPRVKSVLAVSAVALWYKACRLSRAQTLARHYLAMGTVVGDDLRELDELIREARRRDNDNRAHSMPGLSWRSEAARQYCEVLDEIEWRRATGPSAAATSGAVANELERLWANLNDEDHEAIERELEALEMLDSTGEFLYADVELDRVAEAGPRAARASR
jgi:hypothetical protein